MTTEVANAQNNALAAAASLKGKLQKTAAKLPDPGGSEYLRFLQDGHWVVGQENVEIMKADLVAVNPMEIRTGFSCWTDRPGKEKNEILGEVLYPLGADVPSIHDMTEKLDSKYPDAGPQEWRDLISLKMVVVDGELKGRTMEYKTTSVGGIRACRTLIDAILVQLDEDPAAIVPVVSLDGDHYMHKSYGRTYTPILRIKQWEALNATALSAPADDTPDTEKKAAPADDADQVNEPADAQVEDAETVDEKPTEETGRRRRRRG